MQPPFEPQQQHPVPPQQPQYPPADQPVAYDQHGRPLYAHPPTQPQLVHVARAMEPIEQEIPPEIQRRHEQSAKKYPNLNMSNGEFVVSAVRRHWIGIAKIWGIALALITALSALFVTLFMGDNPTLGAYGTSNNTEVIGLASLAAFFVLIAIGAFIATYVYYNNRFYLTNESVIQEIQTTLFSRHEQTVSLANIEDASYKQDGIVAHIFGYGTIRLSTEGDETTYRFTYVKNPKQHIAVLNNAVEAFKNGRPFVPARDED